MQNSTSKHTQIGAKVLNQDKKIVWLAHTRDEDYKYQNYFIENMQDAEEFFRLFEEDYNFVKRLLSTTWGRILKTGKCIRATDRNPTSNWPTYTTISKDSDEILEIINK